MTSRRKFLEATATAGVGALLPWRVNAQASAATAAAAAPAPPVVVSPPLAKFVDGPKYTQLLPQPGVAKPIGTHTYNVIDPATGLETGATATCPLYDFTMVPLTQKLHPDLGGKLGTPVWGYQAMWTDGVVRPFYPGPTIEATRGQTVAVKWRNNLGSAYLLGPQVIDNTLDGMLDANGNPLPAVRVVSHRHGGEQPAAVDGIPHQWYVQTPTDPTQPYPDGGTGHHFVSDLFVYPNDQEATTLWYHDHALGVTRTNVYAGLAGFWLLREANEALLGLPSGAYEYPMAIQDRTFNKDGSLWYPPAPIVPEFFGDTIVVNSQVWPRLNAEPRRYRFRLLNGCTARFLRMRLVEADTTGKPLMRNKKFIPGPSLWQIGTDGGFLSAPVEIGTAANPIIIGPGERCDVLVDFSGTDAAGVPWNGRHFLMYNDAATPFSNTASTKGAIPEIFLVSVRVPLAGTDTSTPIANLTLPAAAVPSPANPAKVRNITLNELMLGRGLVTALNGVGYMSNPITMQPVGPTEIATLGDTEIWNLVNTTVDTHPIHLHHSMFKIVQRKQINMAAYLADDALVPPGDPNRPDPFLAKYDLGIAAVGPDPNEDGLKDTVRANPGEVTQIAVRFNNYVGEYVWHCHILEHEEHDMMRPLIVNAAV